jgi:hypothetical protein
MNYFVNKALVINILSTITTSNILLPTTNSYKAIDIPYSIECIRATQFEIPSRYKCICENLHDILGYQGQLSAWLPETTSSHGQFRADYGKYFDVTEAFTHGYRNL